MRSFSRGDPAGMNIPQNQRTNDEIFMYGFDSFCKNVAWKIKKTDDQEKRAFLIQTIKGYRHAGELQRGWVDKTLYGVTGRRLTGAKTIC